MTRLPVCAVVGVGPGLGAAYARRFHQSGYAVALIARSDKFTAALAAQLGESARAYKCDVASEAALTSSPA
jgi:NAD(P)-dependent dehydrogenase (short-subunit alcohol dehydrogenase family)